MMKYILYLLLLIPFSVLAQLKAPGKISRNAPTDSTYALMDDTTITGGMHTYSSIASRDAAFRAVRRPGMLASVTFGNKPNYDSIVTYQLGGDSITWTRLFKSGTVGSQNLQQTTNLGDSTSNRLVSSRIVKGDSLDSKRLKSNEIFFGDTLINKKRLQFIFWGDSETFGYKLNPTYLYNYATLVSNSLGYQVVNKGITGSKLQRVTVGDSSMFDRLYSIPVYNPNVHARMSFAYFVNDASGASGTYTPTIGTQQYKTIIDTCIARSWPKDSLTVCTPAFYADSYGAFLAQRLKDYRDSAISVANFYGIKYVDFYNAITQNGRGQLLMDDSLHPNRRGQEFMAQAFLDTLKKPGIKRFTSNVFNQFNRASVFVQTIDSTMLSITDTAGVEMFSYQLPIGSVNRNPIFYLNAKTLDRTVAPEQLRFRGDSYYNGSLDPLKAKIVLKTDGTSAGTHSIGSNGTRGLEINGDPVLGIRMRGPIFSDSYISQTNSSLRDTSLLMYFGYASIKAGTTDDLMRFRALAGDTAFRLSRYGAMRVRPIQTVAGLSYYSPAVEVQPTYTRTGAVILINSFLTADATPGVYNAITPSPTTGVTGTGLIVNVTVNSALVASFTIDFGNAGTGYKAGDVLTIPRSAIGSPTAGNYNIVIGDINNANFFATNNAPMMVNAAPYRMGANGYFSPAYGAQVIGSNGLPVNNNAIHDEGLYFVSNLTSYWGHRVNGVFSFGEQPGSIYTPSAFADNIQATVGITSPSHTASGNVNANIYNDQTTAYQTASSYRSQKFIQGGVVGSLTVTGGSGYTDGTYNTLAASGGSGSGLVINVTVSGGVVTGAFPAVGVSNPTAGGSNYVNGDVITATIPGGGSGFSATVGLRTSNTFPIFWASPTFRGNPGDVAPMFYANPTIDQAAANTNAPIYGFRLVPNIVNRYGRLFLLSGTAGVSELPDTLYLNKLVQGAASGDSALMWDPATKAVKMYSKSRLATDLGVNAGGETLASVTARGATTSTPVIFNGPVTANNGVTTASLGILGTYQTTLTASGLTGSRSNSTPNRDGRLATLPDITDSLNSRVNPGGETLQSVTTRGGTTTNSITALDLIATGGVIGNNGVFASTVSGSPATASNHFVTKQQLTDSLFGRSADYAKLNPTSTQVISGNNLFTGTISTLQDNFAIGAVNSGRTVIYNNALGFGPRIAFERGTGSSTQSTVGLYSNPASTGGTTEIRMYLPVFSDTLVGKNDLFSYTALYGTSTQTATVGTTTYTIAHGISGVTSSSKVFITARTVDAAGWRYVDVDATNITIYYSVSPTASTSLKWDWEIKK